MLNLIYVSNKFVPLGIIIELSRILKLYLTGFMMLELKQPTAVINKIILGKLLKQNITKILSSFFNLHWHIFPRLLWFSLSFSLFFTYYYFLVYNTISIFTKFIIFMLHKIWEIFQRVHFPIYALWWWDEFR